jgi:hypothetical protein
MYKKSGDFYSNFVQIMAIENLKKRFILALSFYNIIFGYLKPAKKKKKKKG